MKFSTEGTDGGCIGVRLLNVMETNLIIYNMQHALESIYFI